MASTTTTDTSATITPSSSPSRETTALHPAVIAAIAIAGIGLSMLYCYVWWGRMAWQNFRRARRPTVSHNNDGMQQVHRPPSGVAPSPMPSVRTRSQPRQPLSTTPVASLAPLSQIVILPRQKLSLSSHAERSGTEINTHIADSECPICFEDMTVRVSVASSFCGHQLCQTCRELVVSTAERNGAKARCHACRAPYV